MFGLDSLGSLGGSGGSGGGSIGGGGGGGGASSSASSSLDLGNDTYNYGNISPAAPPSQKSSWLIPAIVGGAALVIVAAMFIFKRK